MIVKLSEFKTNISKYIEQVQDEDIVITRNGEVVARLVAEQKPSKVDALMSLRGILKDNSVTLEEAREERLARQ